MNREKNCIFYCATAEHSIFHVEALCHDFDDNSLDAVKSRISTMTLNARRAHFCAIAKLKFVVHMGVENISLRFIK